MENPQATRAESGPARTEITCGRCGAKATVPFVPTPGRPVYCRACFERRAAASPMRRPGMRSRDAPNATPPKRMLSMSRKGHFVHDALAALDAEADMEEAQQRAFVEMLFARGSRQTTVAALEYVDEKREEGLVSDPEAERLARLVEKYSVKR